MFKTEDTPVCANVNSKFEVCVVAFGGISVDTPKNPEKNGLFCVDRCLQRRSSRLSFRTRNLCQARASSTLSLSLELQTSNASNGRQIKSRLSSLRALATARHISSSCCPDQREVVARFCFFLWSHLSDCSPSNASFSRGREGKWNRVPLYLVF